MKRGEAVSISETNTVRWHMTFSGRVQHVGFRYTACYLARGLYLLSLIHI